MNIYLSSDKGCLGGHHIIAENVAPLYAKESRSGVRVLEHLVGQAQRHFCEKLRVGLENVATQSFDILFEEEGRHVRRGSTWLSLQKTSTGRGLSTLLCFPVHKQHLRSKKINY